MSLFWRPFVRIFCKKHSYENIYLRQLSSCQIKHNFKKNQHVHILKTIRNFTLVHCPRNVRTGDTKVLEKKKQQNMKLSNSQLITR